MGDLLSDFASWLVEVLLYIPRQTLSLLLQGLSALIQALPVPAAFQEFAGYAAQLTPGLIWGFDLVAAKESLAIVLAALTARFLLRRIPFIGA